MKRIYLLVLFLSFLQVGCYSQNQKNLTFKEKKESREKETSDSYTWDFGRVKEGEVLRHNFRLKNDSGKTMNIKDVTTSCGCTASEVKKKKLLPGESTLIEVKFNSKGYSGLVQQYVYVHTDNLDTSTPLSINGERNQTIDKPIIRFIIKADVIK